SYLIVKTAKTTFPFTQVKHVISFILYGAVLGSFISAVLGVTGLCMMGFSPWSNYLEVFTTWWVGDGVGVLVITPLLLSARQGKQQPIPVLELLIYIVILLGATLYSLGLLHTGTRQIFLFILLPICMWSAFRLPHYITHLSVTIIAGIAVIATALKVGWFSEGNLNDILINLQLFIGILAVTLLILSSVLLEREKASRRLQTLTTELEQRVTRRTRTLAETVQNLQTEITQRQVLETQLRQSQTQLQDLFNNANDMIQSVSLTDGSFEFVNRAWLETLGYTAQDLERLNIFDVLHPSVHMHCKTSMQQLQTGQRQSLDQLELSFVAKDGHIIEVEGNINSHVVEGKPAYTRGIFRDISERNKNEAKLYNLSTRLSLAVKSGGIGIWEWSFVNETLTWDERMYELYGTPPEKFTGRFTDWSNRVHPDDLAEAQAQFQNAIDQNKELDIEFRVIHPNGNVVYIKANGLIEYGLDGRPLRMIGINTDISDRKKAETEIIKALDHERELNAMKSRFVSNTSHEFRTPLTVISNNAELLQLFGNKLDEVEKQKCLSTILNYVDHTTELINEVLIVSRAESGKIQCNLKPLNVVDFSRQLLQTISLNSLKHQLEFTIKDNRHASQNHIKSTQLDSKILQQSLTNLLTNAIKYSPEGSTVIFQLELLPSAVEFKVIDEGIGIPKEDQRYLFEPFYRATNVEYISGTGLGLSIVKHLVSIHQGSIHVDSHLEQGSCFTIRLPTQWQETL
ncbi:MAG: PAS domain-containing protein, partial [Leptolyngbya sp. SIO3F4]|nr:PAS domain-containing protein [Leptolyngbya sp. SIO3F4]